MSDTSSVPGELRELVRPHVDVSFYLAGGPDVARAGGDAIAHFLIWGWREGRNPHPDFDVAYYLAANPDVAAAGLNPLVHYLQSGRDEGRLPRYSPAQIARELRELVAPHFDAAHYLQSDPYPDVARTDGDPLAHFLIWGWREGRDPHPGFDVAFYLEKNPDVAAAGLNPLVHYLQSGRREGRLPRRFADPVLATLHMAWSRAGRKAPRAVISSRSSQSAERDADAQLLRRLDALSSATATTATQGLVVSISHDDYAESRGGVQAVIDSERHAYEIAGWNYLHISPAFPLVHRLAERDDREGGLIKIRVNGVSLGETTYEIVRQAVARHAARRHVQVIVHHLAGHAPEAIAALVHASRTRPVVWTHDFFTICPSSFLMRNDVSFCGAPAIESMACAICSHGPARREHAVRVRQLFQDTEPIVLAPSASALAQWTRADLPHAVAAVVPLARLTPLRNDENASAFASLPRRETMARPLRVAHLGARAFHKGWSTFEQLAADFADDERYEFVHCGLPDGEPLPPHVEQIPVAVHGGDRQAMVRTLADRAIDVVLCWSLCHETFSFTAHEALAAGAFLIVREGSGNIWPAVRELAPERAWLVRDDVELARLFESGELVRRVGDAPRRRFTFHPVAGTAEWRV